MHVCVCVGVGVGVSVGVRVCVCGGCDGISSKRRTSNPIHFIVIYVCDFTSDSSYFTSMH